MHDLKPTPGSKTKKIRVGRGNAAKRGNFCGRGMNGQNARSGGGVRLGFEGGQTTLIGRTPKLKGFKNPNRVEHLAVNLDQIDAVYKDGETVNPQTLAEKGLIKNEGVPVKILGNGKCSKKVTVEGLKMSKSVEKALA